ncbi:MAG: hypothetical protein KatS3mg002_1358 [Candidatus Woesearchaeota archaeon]|nr:MAG: hypothetical protein KatS3mg002_1358 [Candidatus Woesearchaeota archaeon]
MIEIYKETAEKLGISEKLVKKVYIHKCKWLREQFKTMDYSIISEPQLGKFKLKIKHLKKRIKNTTNNQLKQKLQKHLENYGKTRTTY